MLQKPPLDGDVALCFHAIMFSASCSLLATFHWGRHTKLNLLLRKGASYPALRHNDTVCLIGLFRTRSSLALFVPHSPVRSDGVLWTTASGQHSQSPRVWFPCLLYDLKRLCGFWCAQRDGNCLCYSMDKLRNTVLSWSLTFKVLLTKPNTKSLRLPTAARTIKE